MRREWRVFVESWKEAIIDAIFISSVFSLSIGYFLPAMGMPRVMRIPVFIGTIIVFCVSQGFATGLTLTFDFESNRMLQYHASLPTKLWIVGCAYVGGAIMRMILITAPVTLMGLTMLAEWQVFEVSLMHTCVMIALVTLFWSLLFLTLALWCSPHTMMDGLWPRVISPMFAFGCTFFPWKKIAMYSPRIGSCLLLNPMTHCVEGLRSALLPSAEYVPFFFYR